MFRKKIPSDELFLHFSFESSESDRVFNHLHDSNSIFRARGINSEWIFGRTVCEDVIMAIRLQEIHSRQLFAALDRSEEGFCDTCKEACHIDPSLGFKHKRELGRLLTLWNTAKVQRDTKVQIEAVHKAHGEPISMIVLDWSSLIRTFNTKYTNNIHPSLSLPAAIVLRSF